MECGAITVISHYGTTGSCGIAREEGVGAIGDGDGPLRDTFTNRDINTKRSFIFFYASLSPTPTATSPANFNETLPATPRENSRRPPMALEPLSSLFSCLFPIPYPLLPGSRSGFRARFTPRSRALAAARRRILWRLRAVSIFEIPPIRATLELITFLDGIYTRENGYIYRRRRGILRGVDNPAFGRLPVKARCRVSDFKARDMERISPCDENEHEISFGRSVSAENPFSVQIFFR